LDNVNTTIKKILLGESESSYTIHQHKKDGSVQKWGSGHSLESAKKEAITTISGELGSKFGHEFSIKDENGNPVHHFKYGKRPHNGGSYVWDKLSGKIHSEI
jgi:hypothetical protein